MLISDRVNLVNDIQSSTNSSKYTPNLSAVRSFVNLFLDQDQENNVKKNQSNFRTPVGLREYTQNKNNIEILHEYEFDLTKLYLLKKPLTNDELKLIEDSIEQN